MRGLRFAFRLKLHKAGLVCWFFVCLFFFPLDKANQAWQWDLASLRNKVFLTCPTGEVCVSTDLMVYILSATKRNALRSSGMIYSVSVYISYLRILDWFWLVGGSAF